MPTLIVASQNPVKIAAARAGFARMFPDQIWETQGFDAPSGVSHQPMGDAETVAGAEGRCTAARAAHPEVDYIVGIEGGCGEDPAGLEAFAWVVVYDVLGRAGRARSGSFLLPPAVAELVRQGVELGVADDRVFGRSNSKQANGAIGLLTGDVIDRLALYEHAVVLALVAFRNPELYF
ncbi:MAG TPA: inosine/xanthosine triphosphatase [Anaerolineales bacterium]|nr:inosine/xanthosine triphosphatase [Anaerolineales bacterium]